MVLDPETITMMTRWICDEETSYFLMPLQTENTPTPHGCFPNSHYTLLFLDPYDMAPSKENHAASATIKESSNTTYGISPFLHRTATCFQLQNSLPNTNNTFPRTPASPITSPSDRTMQSNLNRSLEEDLARNHAASATIKEFHITQQWDPSYPPVPIQNSHIFPTPKLTTNTPNATFQLPSHPASNRPISSDLNHPSERACCTVTLPQTANCFP